MSEDKRLDEVIRIQKRTNNFVMLDKGFLEDERLSFKAKGILAYLLSKPDNWKVIVKNLVNASAEGKAAVYAGLKELKECGYYEKVPVRNEQGTHIVRWESTIYEVPREMGNHQIPEQSEEKPETQESSETSDIVSADRPMNICEENRRQEDTVSQGTSVCNFAEDSFEMEMTVRLIDACLQSLPNQKGIPDNPISKGVWAVYIHQLLQMGYAKEQIRQAMDYAITNSFWKVHIRSTRKFQEKFEILYLKSQQEKSMQKTPGNRVKPLLPENQEVDKPDTSQGEKSLLPDFLEIENQEIENRKVGKRIINNNTNNNSRESHDYNTTLSKSVMSCHTGSITKNTTSDRTKDKTDLQSMRKIICSNIGYERLKTAHAEDAELVDEIVMIILDALLSRAESVYLDGERKPRELLKNSLMKLTDKDIEHVISQFKAHGERIQKKQKYILTMLYHTPMERHAHESQIHLPNGSQKPKKAGTDSRPSKNRFCNFEGHEYNYDELEKQLLNL